VIVLAGCFEPLGVIDKSSSSGVWIRFQWRKLDNANPHAKIFRGCLALTALLLLTSVGLAADPGLAYPASAEVSDQKAGSILFYNIYSSSPGKPCHDEYSFNVTNTSSSSAAFVHLFFVEGTTCSVADR
jgi:hypothetical protein